MILLQRMNYYFSKWSKDQNILLVNAYHLHVHFNANQTHFHLNGFTQGLALKMRQRATWKWSISSHHKINVTFIFFSDVDNPKFNQHKVEELMNDGIELKGLLPENSMMPEDEDDELEFEVNVQSQR